MSRSVVRSRIACSVLAAGAAIFMLAGISAVNVHAENITGQVFDPQGKAVTDAQVRLFDRNGGAMRSTTSSKGWQLQFSGNTGGELSSRSGGIIRNSWRLPAKSWSSGDQKTDLKLAITGTKTEVLVTASGTPLNVDEIAKAVDVVDSEEIAFRDEISISEAVRDIPGIRVQTQEGPGSYTTIQSRGLRAQDTAILIDGMRFRDAASPQGDATYFLEDMSVIDTERIEVLRGSGSSLYGSHALGGVINISSRPEVGRRTASFSRKAADSA